MSSLPRAGWCGGHGVWEPPDQTRGRLGFGPVLAALSPLTPVTASPPLLHTITTRDHFSREFRRQLPPYWLAEMRQSFNAKTFRSFSSIERSSSSLDTMRGGTIDERDHSLCG
ncbi:uncharacterized protein PV06_08942 [Exophiala oligosperma]|uniref:Uncharacterized protein n=1 Tax=Exophiala oligosperma TaxID=215243 RepID=A0A0D2DU53_9EURO|nr:uncharacterized protein PV06_08942 [Exophiala oligosperma]KIW39139.1 hypothetical protein PV06_08942 [Exophiala oligosperma]